MNVNVWFTNWHATGSTVPVDQYEVDITVHWMTNEGNHREHTETVQFPNILAQVPKAWLKDELEDLVLRVLRKRLGVD